MVNCQEADLKFKYKIQRALRKFVLLSGSTLYSAIFYFYLRKTPVIYDIS